MNNPGIMARMQGLSTEINYSGRRLLVQTQNIGGPSSYIETLVYLGGQLVLSRKVPYTSRLGIPAEKNTLARMAAEAHDSVLEDLRAGRLDHRLPKPRP